MISIIVLTYNDPARLRLCLHSLLRQTLPDYELVVADDGGDRDLTRPVYDEIRAYGREITEVWLGPETSEYRAAAARNAGLKCVHGDRVLFLDGDCIVAPDVVANHAVYESEHLLVNGARKHISQKCLEWLQPEHFNQLEQHVRAHDRRYYMPWPVFRPLQEQLARGLKTVRLNNYEQVWSFQVSLPTSVICSIGGFNEEFVGYGGEDQELAARLERIRLPMLGRFDLISYHIDHPTAHGQTCTWMDRVRRSAERPDPMRNGGPLPRAK